MEKAVGWLATSAIIMVVDIAHFTGQQLNLTGVVDILRTTMFLVLVVLLDGLVEAVAATVKTEPLD